MPKKTGSLWDDIEGTASQVTSYPRSENSRREPIKIANSPCYLNHQPMILQEGWGALHGGNCRDHAHVLADVYIGLDECARAPYFDPVAPDEKVAVYYPIRNMSIPNKPEKFDRLVDWIIECLQSDRDVHVGCIGGHGRTGLVLAAVVAKVGVSDDPIAYVRENYCTKAVESQAQVNFLIAHYGAKPINPRHGSAGVDKRLAEF